VCVCVCEGEGWDVCEERVNYFDLDY